MKKKNAKKLLLIAVAAIIAAVSFSACNGTSETHATADEAALITSTQPVTAAVTGKTEQAIAEQGLTVNGNGEIVDANGKKVTTTQDGKVKITTDDGQTVEVTANEIKQATDKTAQNNNSTANNNQSQATKTNNQQTTNNNSSTNHSNSGNAAQNTPGNSAKQQTSVADNQKADSGKTSSVQPDNNSDPHAGKTYHEAVYKTVNHPAETKQVKVIDQEAYSYEEPVYEIKRIAKCKDCGIDLAQLSADERTAHSKNHVLNEGGDGGWYSTTEEVQVGTRTVNVPEQSHMETVVVKEAWTEQVLVKEAGWY